MKKRIWAAENRRMAAAVFCCVCDNCVIEVREVNVKDMRDMFYNCNSLKNKPTWYKK